MSLRTWWEWHKPEMLGSLMGIGIGAFLILALVAAIKEEQHWNAFKAAHKCKVVAQISGSVGTTVGSDMNGSVVVGTTSIPGKTGWLCDDGVTYYR